MANDITAPHVWNLDTAGVVKAIGIRVQVLHVHYHGAVDTNDLILQEYDSSGTVKTAVILRVGADLVKDISFFPGGLWLNGLVVGTIDGGNAYVTVGATEAVITA